MAGDPQTLSALSDAIAAWTEQDFSAAQIEQFVALGERVLARTIFTPDREATAMLPAAAEMPLPADFWGLRSAPAIEGGAVLVRMEPGALRAAYGADAGSPAHFAIEGNVMKLGPAPGDTTPIRLHYWAAIPPLGPGQETNWLLAAHPDLYLAASLVEAFTFHMDEARAGFWSRRLADKSEEINRAGRRRGSGSGPLAARSGRTA
jgi:hypothetical protein